MGIDIIVAIVVVIAFIKGYGEGIIMSLFSVSAYLIGFLAAMHFSFVFADYITANVNLPEQWIPIVSFILLFIAVILIVRWIGKLLEKGVGKLLPTFFNKFVGGALWVVISFVLLSLLYQVLDSANLFTDSLKAESNTLIYLKKAGFYIKNNIGEVIPFIENLYEQVDNYFEEIAGQIGS